MRLVLGFSSCLDDSQSSSPPLRLVLDWVHSLLYPSFLSSPPGRPARGNPKRFRSKVISFSLLFSAGCCHGTIQSDLPYPSLLKSTRASSARSPLASCRRPLDPLWLSPSFSSSFLMWFFYNRCPPGYREVRFLLQPPFLSSSEERLGSFLKELPSLLPRQFFLHVLLLSPKAFLGGYCMHWRRFWRCLLFGRHWLCLCLPAFWTTFLHWSGCASLFAGEEHLRGFWVLARCMSSFFVPRGFTKSWVGQVASRSPTNRQAVDLAVSLDDQGH